MSIHKEKSGWKVRYRIGEKQYSKNGFKTKREAEAFESEQLRKIRNQSWTEPAKSKTTLDEIFKSWISVSTRSARTNYDYQQLWESRIQPTWGHYPVKSIAPTDLAKWFADLQNEYKPTTVRKILTIFSQVLDWAVTDRRIEENPLKRVKETSRGPLVKNRITTQDKVVLTHQQVTALAEAVPAHYKDFILFLAYTGLRFGEATALQIRDVNLLKKRLHVKRSWSYVGGQLIEGKTKNSQDREVPIPELLIASVESRVNAANSPSDLLFKSVKGLAIRNESFRRKVFVPALNNCGVEDFTIHGLRHTYAALAVQAGVNPKTLQKAMGHSDIRLTMDIYGGIFDDDLDGLSNSLNESARHIRNLNG